MTAICCPGELPCADHKKTKADLIGELERTRAELAAARSLLQAIKEACVVPYISREYMGDNFDFSEYKRVTNARSEQQNNRLIAIEGAAAYVLGDGNIGSYAVAEKVLRKRPPLGYKTDES